MLRDHRQIEAERRRSRGSTEQRWPGGYVSGVMTCLIWV
jgi:hypothetical protein